jgi:hypothetical protein
MNIRFAMGTAALGLAMVLAGTARAASFEFPFDDSIDPFDSFSESGVTFTVEPALFASAGNGFWSDLDYDFVLGGALELEPSATLTIEFDVLAASLEFGVARRGSSDLFDVVTVELLDAGGSPLTPNVELPLFAGDTAPERRFTASGVKRVVLGLDAFAGDPIAVDNIIYTPVPEPSAWAMLLAGLLALWPVVRRAR